MLSVNVESESVRYELQKGKTRGRLLGVLRSRKRLSALHDPRSSTTDLAKMLEP